MRLLFEKIDARQYAALRIVFGFFTLLTLLALLPEVTFSYSDQGWFPVQSALKVTYFKEWSLLHSISSPMEVKSFFGVLIVASLCLMVGFYTRIANFICFIGIVSIQSRNWFNTYGGDAVLRMMLFYLLLSPSGLAWSVDALIKNGMRKGREIHFAAIWPLRLIQFQVCMIYLTTGIAKLHGSEWLNGSALSLVLLNPEFARWNFDFIDHSPMIMAILRCLTYLTLAFELGFSILILNRITRWLVLILGVGMHFGTIVTLQIHFFGYIMIATYLAFLPRGMFQNLRPIRPSFIKSL